MKTPIFARGTVIAVSLLAAATPVQIGAQSDTPNLQPIIDSTVRIRVPGTDREGTGWVIAAADPVNRANAAVIVTALSTIERADRITVREPTSTEEYQATVLDRDADRNLIFLEVKDLKAKAITIGEAPGIGAPAWGLGYNRAADDSEQKAGEAAQNMAANASAQSGTLSRELRGPISSEALAPVNQLELNASMLPGFEGGPLVDRCARLIGMDLKSSGAVGPRREMRFRAQVTLTNALKADEIIKAARKAGVEPTIASGPCNGASPAAAGAPASAEADNATGNVAEAPVSVAPPAASSGSLLKSPIFLAVLVLIGLIAAAFGIYTLTRRDAPIADPVLDPLPGGDRPQSRTPTATVDGTTLVRETRTISAEKTLRLNGRGPAGEPIDFTFSSTELQARPVMIGVGTNADVRFPDNRTDHRVSRRHAQLGYDGRTFTLLDNKSTNHTFVGGRELDGDVAAPLVNGDVIRFADIEVTVSID